MSSRTPHDQMNDTVASVRRRNGMYSVCRVMRGLKSLVTIWHVEPARLDLPNVTVSIGS